MLSVKRKAAIEEFLAGLKLGSLVDASLVSVALTHPSFLYEGIGTGEHNQRLEFLGDAIVGLVVGQHLYRKYPEKSEGELTKMRAVIVCEASLARSAKTLGLGKYLLLGRGESRTGGSERASNLADAFEALMGALYLSIGLDHIAPLILELLNETIDEAEQGKFGDYKTQLQELIQKKPDQSLTYKILTEEGPDHDKVFEAGVFLNGVSLSTGVGKSKKEAEQQAARQALLKLEA